MRLRHKAYAHILCLHLVLHAVQPRIGPHFVKIVYRKMRTGTLVFHHIYFPEYRPDGVVDYRPPFLFDDDHVYPQRFAVQGMFKHKTQAVTVWIQHKPDNIAEGGMPGYGFIV